MKTHLQAGIDLGGSKIEMIVLDNAGATCFSERVTTPQGDYQATLDAIQSLVGRAQQNVGSVFSLGIGVPGSLSPETGLMRNANSTCLNGQPLSTDLEEKLQRPLSITNDANCFALSEATDGAGRDAASVFGVILGTGTGAGMVVNGQLLTGINGIAGEWGHNPLPWPDDNEYPGQQCWCGRQSCIETWLSGPALSRDHLKHTSWDLTAEDIVQASVSEDTGDAVASLQRYELRLAKSLAHVINLFDPQVIVLGGGLSNCKRFYATVPDLWDTYIFSDCVRTQLLPPKFGDASGVRGAAWLGRQQTNGQ